MTTLRQQRRARRPRCSSSMTIPARGCCSARRWRWRDFGSPTAADGAGALAAFRAQPVDCIILDVVMPGMNGFDACIALRALPDCHHVPILMQTSLDDMDSVNRAYTAGATDFSSKGINPMLLAQRVKFLVRAKRTQDQLLRERGARALSRLLRSAHRIAEPAAAAAAAGGAGGMGDAAADAASRC